MKDTSRWTNRFSLLPVEDVNSNRDAFPKTEKTEIVPENPSPPTPTPPCVKRRLIRNTKINPDDSVHLRIVLEANGSIGAIDTEGLLDCAAQGLFIDTTYVRQKGLDAKPLANPIEVYNVDGTHNEGGDITHTVRTKVLYEGHTEEATFHVTNLGGSSIILGLPWLRQHNPEVDWRTGTVSMTRCPSKCRLRVSERRKSEREKKSARKRRETSAEMDDIREEGEGSDDDAEATEGLGVGERVFMTLIHTDRPPPKHVRATGTKSQQLAEAAQRAQPEKTFEEIVPREYWDYQDVFSKESFDELPDRRQWDHAIELIPEAQARNCKLYPLSPPEQKELDAFIKENLDSGRIRPSKSPMAAPIFFGKKKDGSLRIIHDYRALNAITKKNRYPLPLISELVNKLRNARFFTKLDVRWGYNNVRIREGDEWKAAFRTNRGLYEPLVMMFGLTNSPATFQTMMNDIFRELIDQGVVVVYLDDILIFTGTMDEHQRVVRQVLDVLRAHRLYLRSSKCEFESQRIEYLGLVISEGRISMDPVKVAGVQEWPVPKNTREVLSFVMFVNFYRRFIRGFSDITRPLHDLTKKDTAWRWTAVEQTAFDALKLAVTTAPVLAFPNDCAPYRVEADSSDFATGAVLSQVQEDGKWHPVAFLSKSLDQVQRNYDIGDKEMLAIIRALTEWRHFLEGAEHRFEILSDHQNLKSFMAAKDLNRRQARWSLYLSRFDFLLTHRPGKHCGKPDALSRRPDHRSEGKDNEDIVLLKPEYFRIAALRRGHATMVTDEKQLLRMVREVKEWDESVVKAVEELKRSGVKNVRGREWSEEQGLVLFRGKVYVPKDDELRRRLLEAYHDAPAAGHPGRWKTLELVSRNYWWPGMSRYVDRYVSGCDRCNRAKTFPSARAGLLLPNQVPERKWGIVTADLITELPPCNEKDAILVVADRAGKRAHFVATTSSVSSPGLAELYLHNVWRHHGLPDGVISDRGPQFVSNFMRELNRLLGVKTSPSTAYHPQSDGQTERINQDLETFLRMFVNQRQDDWADWLPIAEFAYNNRVHSATRQTPFMMEYGFHPRTSADPVRNVKVEAAGEFVTRMKGIDDEAKAALARAADDMARHYDAHRNEAPEYQVGDKVWLDGRDIRTMRPTKKLDDKWYGPFEIERIINRNACRLKLPPRFRIHPTFHVSKLRRSLPDTIPGRQTPPVPPPPVLKDGAVEYEVERIDDSRVQRGRLQYLVKWKGYPPSENTWESTSAVRNSQDLIDEFHRDHPLAPAPGSSGRRPLRGG